MAKKRIKLQNEKIEAKAKGKNILVTTSLLVGVMGATIGGVAIANDYKHNKADMTPGIVENTPQYKKGYEDGQTYCTETINALRKELVETREARSEAITERDNALTKITELTTELENKQIEVETVTTAKNQSEQELATVTNEKTLLEKQVEELSTDKTSNEQQINQLNVEIATKTEKINELNGNIANYENNIANLNSQITTLSSEKSQLTTQVAEKDAQINDINNTLQNVQNTIVGLETGEKVVATFHSPDGLSINRYVINKGQTFSSVAPETTLEDPENQQVRFNVTGALHTGQEHILGNWDIYIEIVNLVTINFVNGSETIPIKYVETDKFETLESTPYQALSTPDGYEFAGWARTENGEVIDVIGCPVTDFSTLYAIWQEKVQNVASFKIYSNMNINYVSSYAQKNKSKILGNATISATEPNGETFFTQDVDDNFKNNSGEYEYLPYSTVRVFYRISKVNLKGLGGIHFTLSGDGNSEDIYVGGYTPENAETRFGMAKNYMEEDGDYIKYVCEVKFDKITVDSLQFDFYADELTKTVNITDQNGTAPAIYYKVKQFSNNACSRDASWVTSSSWKSATEPLEVGYFGKYQILFNFEKQSEYVNVNSTIRLADTTKSIKDNTSCVDMTLLTVEESENSIYFTNIGDNAKFEITIVSV